MSAPTLAMIVDREIALRNFVPEDYIEVVATFQGREDPNKESYSRLLGAKSKQAIGSARLRETLSPLSTGYGELCWLFGSSPAAADLGPLDL